MLTEKQARELVVRYQTANDENKHWLTDKELLDLIDFYDNVVPFFGGMGYVGMGMFLEMESFQSIARARKLI